MIQMALRKLRQASGASVNANDILLHLNAAQGPVQSEILLVDPGYMVRDYTVTVVSGTTEYLLPPDANSFKFVPTSGDNKMDFAYLSDVPALRTGATEAFSTRRIGDDLYLVLAETPTVGGTLEIKYVSKLPELLYGRPGAVSGLSFTLSTTAGAGRIKAKANGHVNSRIWITSGTGVGGVRRLVSGTAAGVYTIDSAWSVAPTTTSTYEMVCEIPEEFHPSLVWKACAIWAEDSGKDAGPYYALYNEALQAAKRSIQKPQRSQLPTIKWARGVRPNERQSVPVRRDCWASSPCTISAEG